MLVRTAMAGLILAGCGSTPRPRQPDAAPTAEAGTASQDTEAPAEPAPAPRERRWRGRRTRPDDVEFSSRCGRARVTGQGVFDYTFTGAPTDWRAASGVWRIARRWDCDSRYTFFCGWPDRASSDKAAVIWSKRSFRGDVTIDLHVGAKDEMHRGRRYEYMQDINVTIAADGKDLTSGYTFTFGGFDNTRSAIVRGGDIIAASAEKTARIAVNMMMHHRWWSIHVEREGDSLAFTVGCRGETFVELECTDPEPLTGDRVAIWSYDCGIALARVRISGLPGALADGPDFDPTDRTRTYYDLMGKRTELGRE